MRKVLISLPDVLAERLDAQVKTLKMTRSAYLRDAIERDLNRLAQLRREEMMKQGYRQMGELNLKWAQLAHQADLESLTRYEAALAAQDQQEKQAER